MLNKMLQLKISQKLCHAILTEKNSCECLLLAVTETIRWPTDCHQLVLPPQGVKDPLKYFAPGVVGFSQETLRAIREDQFSPRCSEQWAAVETLLRSCRPFSGTSSCFLWRRPPRCPTSGERENEGSTGDEMRWGEKRWEEERGWGLDYL